MWEIVIWQAAIQEEVMGEAVMQKENVVENAALTDVNVNATPHHVCSPIHRRQCQEPSFHI